MDITTEYSSVERVKYTFDEWEVECALIELIKRHHATKLLDNGVWSLEWQNTDGKFIFTLMQEVKLESNSGTEDQR